VTLPPTFQHPFHQPSSTFHQPVCSTPLYPRGGGTPLHPLERVGRSTSWGGQYFQARLPLIFLAGNSSQSAARDLIS
jgi:hypothetical protein